MSREPADQVGVLGTVGHVRRLVRIVPPAVKDLANALHEGAVGLEVLADGDGIGKGLAEVGVEIPDAGCVGPRDSVPRPAARVVGVRDVDMHRGTNRVNEDLQARYEAMWTAYDASVLGEDTA